MIVFLLSLVALKIVAMHLADRLIHWSPHEPV